MPESIYRIESQPGGRLAILARPRRGDWLEDDLSALRRAGIDVVVSLLTAAESAELGLAEEERACRSQSLEFLTFPIADLGTPRSLKESANFIAEIVTRLVCGKNVGVHCRMGIGRSGIVSAAALVAQGVTPDEAWKRITTARARPVPDTPAQRDWVRAFADYLALRSRNEL